MDRSKSSLEQAWAVVAYRVFPDLIDEWMLAEEIAAESVIVADHGYSVPPVTVGEHRDKLRDIRTLTTQRDVVYAYPGRMKRGADFRYLRDLFRDIIEIYAPGFQPAALAHFRLMRKYIEHDFTRADTRRNYSALAEALCHRAAVEWRFNVWMSQPSQRHWCHARYSLNIYDQTCVDANRYFEKTGLLWRKPGVPGLKSRTPNAFTLVPEPFAKATEAETIEWMDLNADAYDAMRQIEAAAFDRKRPAKIDTYVDEKGRKRARL